MKRICNIVSIVLLSLSMTGCLLYKPQLADVPLIEHKGDVRAAAALYILPEPAVDATITAGLTDHLAAQIHTCLEGNEVFYSHVALGCYYPHEKTLFEWYLGAGRGRGSVYIDADPAKAYGPYMCEFVQMNYGWRLKGGSIFGFSMKGGALMPQFRWSEPTYIDGEMLFTGDKDQKTHLLLEPQFFYRVGGEHVKFQIQLGFCYVSDMFERRVLRYIPWSFSTGISIKL